MRRNVRILLVGDDGVGKSTLITSLIKETFEPHVQHVVPEVTIPPEVTPENVTTHIVDSSARPSNQVHLNQEIRKAHVICIVYAIDDPASFHRIGTYWLPYIRSLGVNVPVVLVGNKIDVRGEDVTNTRLEEEIMPIMNGFKEVETSIECSAKHPLNVSEIFYFAQKAVLYPTAPLYDSREHVLKPSCIQALRRIFKLCDMDKDGILKDDELNEFQRKCFNAPLQQQELKDVKEVVKEHEPNGVVEDGLNCDGFLFLHTLFIQRGRLETTWTVLRKFGYGDDLSLREDFLSPPTFDVPQDSTVELSSDGYRFFTELFQSFDKDKDGALRTQELEELFETSPGNPWEFQGFPQTTITNEAGSVTLQGFLAQWSMTTLLEPKTTLAYLAYLGYPGRNTQNRRNDGSENDQSDAQSDVDTRTALKIMKTRKADRRRGKGKVARGVFLCYVFGAAGSGKTALLKGFVRKPFSEAYAPTAKPFSVVNSVEIQGSEKHLVMQEFGSQYEGDVLSSRKKIEQCDLLCFVYDSSDVNSFAYLANLRKQYDLNHIPHVFVATKSDLDLVQQRYEVQPDVYCRALRLAVPISVSLKEGQTANVFTLLTGVAMNPSVATPSSKSDRSRTQLKLLRFMTAVSVVGVVVVAGVYGYRIFRSHGTSGGGP